MNGELIVRGPARTWFFYPPSRTISVASSTNEPVLRTGGSAFTPVMRLVPYSTPP